MPRAPYLFWLVLGCLAGRLAGSEPRVPSPEASPLAPATEGQTATTPVAPIRVVDEPALIALLTDALREQVGNRGELQIRLTRGWDPVPLPDEPLSLHLLSLPISGLAPNCILRFELRTAARSLGTWQVPVQASIMNDIWVARVALKRGQAFDPADAAQERRNVLTLRDVLTELPEPGTDWEMADYVPAKGPLTNRSLRARPVVARGDVVEATARAGALNVRLKVEVLESGAPGQLVRVRNPQTRRELYGKITHDRTIELPL